MSSKLLNVGKTLWNLTVKMIELQPMRLYQTGKNILEATVEGTSTFVNGQYALSCNIIKELSEPHYDFTCALCELTGVECPDPEDLNNMTISIVENMFDPIETGLTKLVERF